MHSSSHKTGMPARWLADGHGPKSVTVIKQSRVPLRTIARDSALPTIVGQPDELERTRLRARPDRLAERRTQFDRLGIACIDQPRLCITQRGCDFIMKTFIAQNGRQVPEITTDSGVKGSSIHRLTLKHCLDGAGSYSWTPMSRSATTSRWLNAPN
jgi:hypothetical protein